MNTYSYYNYNIIAFRKISEGRDIMNVNTYAVTSKNTVYDIE